MAKKSAVKRRLKSVVDPTFKKGRAVKKLSAKEKLRRKRLALVRRSRMNRAEHAFDKVRGKVLHKRRTKGKTKKKLLAAALSPAGNMNQHKEDIKKLGPGIIEKGVAKVKKAFGGKDHHKFVDQNASSGSQERAKAHSLVLPKNRRGRTHKLKMAALHPLLRG